VVLEKIDERTALILDLRGHIVEQHSGTAKDALLAEAQGNARRTIQLRDVLTVLDAASKDKRINSAVLLLDA